MEFNITIKDINRLAVDEVSAILLRLSWPDSESNSSIQRELKKRYVDPVAGQQPSMMLALIRLNGELVGWVGTRPWPEKLNDQPIMVQTIECFVDEKRRRGGIARLGLQALISAGFINRTRPVGVYAPAVVGLAKACDCEIVVEGDPAK